MSDGSEDGGANRDQRDRTDQRGDENQEETGGDGQGKGDGSGQSEDEGASTVEKAVMVISATFTVLLFAYAGWQLATPPQTGAPQVSVVGTETMPDGDVAVRVRLRNPADVGLVTTTVESDCSSPPTQVEFSFVPASSTRTATLVCPPGTTDPGVSISNWVSR